ncbi:hypothetical protein J6590_063296 [Homalodisca vitripennis]|nr:hypothetical protein J6590_063296 [Homalodisca vitripennis]
MSKNCRNIRKTVEKPQNKTFTNVQQCVPRANTAFRPGFVSTFKFPVLTEGGSYVSVSNDNHRIIYNINDRNEGYRHALGPMTWILTDAERFPGIDSHLDEVRNAQDYQTFDYRRISIANGKSVMTYESHISGFLSAREIAGCSAGYIGPLGRVELSLIDNKPTHPLAVGTSENMTLAPLRIRKSNLAISMTTHQRSTGRINTLAGKPKKSFFLTKDCSGPKTALC